jgi:ribosome-binding protein aMBF1 (putative translation factor)
MQVFNAYDMDKSRYRGKCLQSDGFREPGSEPAARREGLRGDESAVRGCNMTCMSITTNKAETVRARRVALGITQRELARLAACSTGMVQEIEARTVRGGRSLASVLGVLDEIEAHRQAVA